MKIYNLIIKEAPTQEILEAIRTATAEEINYKEQNGWTPLHWAAFCNRREIGEALIKAGANVNVKNNHGKTPLDIVKILWCF